MNHYWQVIWETGNWLNAGLGAAHPLLRLALSIWGFVGAMFDASTDI